MDKKDNDSTTQHHSVTTDGQYNIDCKIILIKSSEFVNSHVYIAILALKKVAVNCFLHT